MNLVYRKNGVFDIMDDKGNKIGNLDLGSFGLDDYANAHGITKQDALKEIEEEISDALEKLRKKLVEEG